MNQNIKTIIDTQVILQILLEKEICTIEDIFSHRKYVSKLPKFAQMIDNDENPYKADVLAFISVLKSGDGLSVKSLQSLFPRIEKHKIIDVIEKTNNFTKIKEDEYRRR